MLFTVLSIYILNNSYVIHRAIGRTLVNNYVIYHAIVLPIVRSVIGFALRTSIFLLLNKIKYIKDKMPSRSYADKNKGAEIR